MPDSSLDSLDVPGFLPERREMVRRDDDRTLRQRCSAVAREISTWAALCMALAGIAGGAFALLGYRFSGPIQAIEKVSTREDSLESRVGRLELDASQTHQQLREISGDMRFLSYQLCVATQSHDPVAVRRCQITISAFRTSPEPP